MEESGSAADSNRIEQLHAAWIAAEREARYSDLLGFCTEDIVIQPPIGATVRGRSAAAEFFLAAASPIESLEITDLTIEVSNSLAVKRARFCTLTAAQQEPVTGTHLWLLKPRWKISFITWSLDSPPA